MWTGGSALFVTGLVVGSTGDDGQQPVENRGRPATTVTASATAAPEPGPTVTEPAKPGTEPRPTVTVTETTTAEPADTGDDSGSDQDATGTCSIVSSSGTCYSAGQFCRETDHGATTSTASGREIKCTFNSDAWRWT